MFCKYCGRQIADDSKFCEFCGELVQRTQQSAPIAPDIGAPILKDEPTPVVPPVVTVPQPEPVASPAPEIPDFETVVPPVTEIPDFETVTPPEPAIPEVDVPEADVPDFAPPTTRPVREERPRHWEEEPWEEEPRPRRRKKKKRTGLIVGLSILGVLLLAGIGTLVWFLTRTPIVKVDVSQFVDFKVSGYDGYGVGTCELDTDGLERAALGEFPIGTDSKSRNKQIEYKEKAAKLKKAVTLEFEKRENLKVGDKLEATLKVDRSVEKELHIEFSTNLSVVYTVTGKDLSGSLNIKVLDEFYDIKIEGMSGNATAALVVKERKEDFFFKTHDGTEYTVEAALEDGSPLLKLHNEDGTVEPLALACELTPKDELQNGDKVTATLSGEAAEKLMDYGLQLESKELSKTVDGLEAWVTSVSQLDQATVEKWVADYGKTLETYLMDNWNEVLHGGNNLASPSVSIENLQCVKKIVAYSDNSNALFLEFTADLSDEAILMDNNGLSKRHFFAVRIENLVMDGEGKLLIERLKLPGDKGEGIFGAYVEYADLQAKTTDTYENVSES